MLKHIIFDFDGTIIDSKYLGVQLINELSSKYGYRKVKDDELEYLSHLSIKERLRIFGVPYYKVPRILLEIKHNFGKSLESLSVYNGMPELIHQLADQGYQLGIISSNAEENIKQVLVKHQIDVFKSIHTSISIFGKSGKIDAYAKKNNVSKEEMIYIGDELRDVHACKKAKVKVISVTWGFDSEKLLSTGNPEHIVTEPNQIAEIIQGY